MEVGGDKQAWEGSTEQREFSYCMQGTGGEKTEFGVVEAAEGVSCYKEKKGRDKDVTGNFCCSGMW